MVVVRVHGSSTEVIDDLRTSRVPSISERVYVRVRKQNVGALYEERVVMGVCHASMDTPDDYAGQIEVAP